MLRRSIRAAMLAVGLVALLTATVSASVTFNIDTGGFAGKGDIQTAFGWTNAQLQTNASSVGFYYFTFSSTTNEWTCTDPATGDVQTVSNGSNSGHQANYATTPRGAKGKVTGFDFVPAGGSGSGTGGGPATNTCPDGYDLTTPAVTTSSSGAGLYVTSNGGTRLLIAF